jgi:hypothetical protein
MTRIMTALHALLLSLALMPSPASAEESLFVKELTEMLQMSRRTVDSWETQALILICLAVTVGALGVLTGILQGTPRQWTKTVTVVVGAIISISTVVSSTVFPADHRTFKQNAASGRVELERMRLILLDLRTSATNENQRAYRDEFMAHYDAIAKLEMGILGKSPSKNTAWLDWVPPLPLATAQERGAERTPGWVRDKPRDTPVSRFFVGVAEAPQLDSARDASLRDAEDQAVRELVRAVTKNTTSVDALEDLRLRDFVKKLADVNETAFVFDKTRSVFKYWTLLRLHPRTFDTTVAAGGASIKVMAGARILQSAAPQYFNGDRTLRVEYANVLIESTGRATLSFQAAATIRARFPARVGPSVGLMFVDRDRKPLGPFRDVAQASVDACGGYENHETVLNDRDFSRGVLDRAEMFVLQLQAGASPSRCDRGFPSPF